MGRKTVFFIIMTMIAALTFTEEGFLYRPFTEEDISLMKDSAGVRGTEKNYNVIIKGFGTGFAPPSAGWYENIAGRGRILAGTAGMKAPASYDNSVKIWFPPIGNQMYEGSCSCWAAVYYMRTFLEAKERGWDFSTASWDVPNNQPSPAEFRLKTFTPDFVYHQINGGGDNGSWTGDAAELMSQIGACLWDHMPYDDDNHTAWPSEAAWRNAPPYRTGGDTWIYLNDSGIVSMKDVLSTEKLIAIAIDAYEYDKFGPDDLLTADSYTSAVTNHANTVVGYDDNYGPYMEGGISKTGAFKVANSWGTGSWENVSDGFWWISYAAIKKLAYTWAHYYEDRTAYEPQLLAVLNISHAARGDLIRKFQRIGGATKSFDEIYYRGGANPYPSNDIVLDITDITGTGPQDVYRLSLKDLSSGEPYPDNAGTDNDGDVGTSTTGSIQKFCIEDYSAAGSDYSTQTPGANWCSIQIPKNTANGGTITVDVSAFEDTTPVTVDISDSRIYPNPLISSKNSSVTITDIPLDGEVTVYTLAGQEVYCYKNKTAAGSHIWGGVNSDGDALASGIYICVVKDGDRSKVMKLVIVK